MWCGCEVVGQPLHFLPAMLVSFPDPMCASIRSGNETTSIACAAAATRTCHVYIHVHVCCPSLTLYSNYMYIVSQWIKN